MMHLYEVSYSSEKGEGKLRVVASASVWAMREAYSRKYTGSKNVSVFVEDQGTVIVADSQKQQLLKVLRDRAAVLTDILDAIGKDITQIETDELLLDKHRRTMDRLAKMNTRLGDRQLTAPRGPFV
jgi:hypothetical protein